uniref:IQ motif and ubiquitin domain-containing n=1 Tax=Xenopus tropicalis TaxID=8364 RepID=A0A6I8RBR8_XENTR
MSAEETNQSIDVAQQTDVETKPDDELAQELSEKDIVNSENILTKRAQNILKEQTHTEGHAEMKQQSFSETGTQMDMECIEPQNEEEINYLESTATDVANSSLGVGLNAQEHGHIVSHSTDKLNTDEERTEEVGVCIQMDTAIDQCSSKSRQEHVLDVKQEEDLATGNMSIEEETDVEDHKVNPEANSFGEVKIILAPDGDVVTMAFSISNSIRDLKNYFASQLKIPETIIQILFEGRVVKDHETLVDLGVTPHGTIQLEMISLDPENFSVKALKLQQENNMPDVITVRVQTDEGSYRDLVVEIERLNYRKPYLGGYRHKATGVVFHHAGTQTVPKKRPDRETVVFCRETQTVQHKNKNQQSRNTMSTQMTKIGCYVSNITDKLITPKRYVTAEELHARQLKAIIVIQTYFRRFHARKVVQQLREEKKLRLEWEGREDLRRKKEKEDQLRKDYERRMNPKTKDDFDLLYHALESWRKEELERINQTYTGAERKAALCELLEQETQLIASIGRHKLNANEENQQQSIQVLLNKCSEPKRWKAFDGKTTEMDTQYTIRARQLRDIYTSINTPYFNADERLDALLTLKLTVKEHDCKLTQEIVELIDREADLLMRGVQNSNLEGLRKRISTLFLQYIKIPTFNPEVARLLKVPEDSTALRKNIYFCPSCKSYLPSTEFSLSSIARTVGRCRKCSKLDNEARDREELSKYKILLKQLKRSEAEYGDGSRIAFLLQQQDLKYLVENIWAAHSALSACDDLYDLAVVRWDKYFEWSPWNCILLTKDEATAHLKLANAEKAYGIGFIRKMKHRHTLAKNYFSQIPEMAPFLNAEMSNKNPAKNDLIN